MEKQERLNDVFNNSSYDDNTVLIRVLNTFLESGEDNSEIIYTNIMYFVNLLDKLTKTSDIDRKDVKYVVENINQLETNPTFDEFTKLLKKIYKQNHTEVYKYMFLLCYCRSKFETYYSKDIYYTDPEYAIMIACGKNIWNTFLQAFEHNKYVYRVVPN